MDSTIWLRFTSAALALGLAAASLPLRAQTAVPIGTWRTHFSYQRVNHLAVTPERVYAAAANGLFSVSRADGSIRILSKHDGFTDVGVVALAYEPVLRALMLAYRSGRIDVLVDGEVRTFDLLQRASAQEIELIYDIHWHGSTAFVSTSQGVRVLTLSPDGVRIEASYTRLSAMGDPLAIYQATTSSDSIFLATNEGVIANALATNVNRQDFGTWRRVPPPSASPLGDVRHVAYQAGTLYAAYDGVGLFQWRGGRWEPTELLTTRPFRALRSTPDALVAITDEQVFALNGGVEAVVGSNDGFIPQDADTDPADEYWIADQNRGLLRLSGTTLTAFSPNGPVSDDLPTIRWVHDRLMALDASPTDELSTFAQGQWTTYGLPAASVRLLDVAFEPSTRTYYLATFGQGLVRWDGEQQFSAVPPPGNPTDTVNLTALAFWEGKFWAGRFGETASLLTYSPDQSAWQAVSDPTLEAAYPRRLAVDRNGSVWMVTGGSVRAEQFGPVVSGTNVLIFNESIDEVQSVVSNINLADLPGKFITDLVVDRNGLVWVGGDQGVAYFPNPGRVFSDVLLVRPVFERQFLLRDEYVTCLAVDGGNRKWVGSRNGLWLFSETGEELVHRFTQENSPLTSDVVLDIAINPSDGEVFVTTDRGLVSYRGGATAGNTAHQSVEVFPNPVPSSFGGTVGIRGLAQDATVKITTVSGALVRELRAQGGTATWDTRNQAGQTVNTGVYLIFSATADGEETYVGKLAVIP